MRTAIVLALGVAACSRGDDVPAPHVAAVEPASGIAGEVVRVVGSDFCQNPEPVDDGSCAAMGVVTFGSAPATTVAWADAEIAVEVPAGLVGPVGVRVGVGGHVSNAVTFTVR